jgi:hypothetical protein
MDQDRPAPAAPEDAARDLVDLAVQGSAGIGGSEQYDDEPAEPTEDEQMAAGRGTPEQQALREAWSEQREDADWTQSVANWLQDRARALVQGEVIVSDVSCRATVCRAYVQFSDQLDATAFQASAQQPGLRYAYQSLDPNFDGQGFDDSDHTFELLIAR